MYKSDAVSVTESTRRGFWWHSVGVVGVLMLWAATAAADLALLSGTIGPSDADLSIVDTSTNQLVREPESPDPAIQGYFSLAVAEATGTVVVGPSNRDGIEILRPGFRSFVPLPETPVWIAPEPDGRRAWISTFDSLELVDLQAGTRETVIDRGMAGVAVSADGSRAYAVFNGTVIPPLEPSLLTIDTTTRNVIGRVILREDFSLFGGVTVSPSGDRVYVADTGGGAPLFVVDPIAQVLVDEISFGDAVEPYHSVFGPDPSVLYVSTSDGVSIIDTASNTVIDSADLEFFQTAIDLDSAGDQLYVLGAGGTLHVLDPTTLDEITTLQLPFGEVFNSNQFIVPTTPDR